MRKGCLAGSLAGLLVLGGVFLVLAVLIAIGWRRDHPWVLKGRCAARSTPACVKLAELYRDQDPAYAGRLFSQACDNGEKSACLDAGELTEAQDAARAVQQYQKSCDAGSAMACNKLARCYESGKGVAKDADKVAEFDGRACSLYADFCKKPDPLPIAEEAAEPSDAEAAPGPASVDAATPVSPATGLPPSSGTSNDPVTDILRVGGAIQAPQKIKDAAPVYPPIALQARVQGVVIVEVIIDTQGRVSEAKVIRSIPLLDQAALDAVRQWRFTPTILNGQPAPVIMTVTVNFTLH
jgi:TonB family protein